VITQFTLDSYAAGLISTALKAPRAEIFEKSELIELSTPAVKFFEGGKLSSTLNAGRGRVHADTHDVWAWNTVVIESTDNVKLTSDWLHYSSAIDRIVSTAPVVIVREGTVIHGRGWEASPHLDDIVVHQQKVEIKQKPK
jgi:LPS export ABC transporter protein LptC